MLKRMILTSMASLLLLGASGTATAAPTWPLAPYSHYAENESLVDLLRDFASGFSLSLDIGSKVGGTVNGKFNASTPTEFLDRLGGVYGFNWFVYAGTLHISRASDMATRTVAAKSGTITGLRQALLQLGVLDTRFGWGELPDQGLALVSGPPGYVSLVERTIAQLPAAEGGAQEVVVFRLKHATVNDRTINYRNQQVVTTGLATTLRNLISGDGGTNDQALSAVAAPLRTNPPVFQNGATTAGTDMVASPNAAGSAGAGAAETAAGGSGAPAVGRRSRQATVQADVRLNALIVQDIPERLPIYRQLIAQLDVPTTLVKIEAMIVDVSSSVVNDLGISWGAQAGSTSFGYNDLGVSPSGGLPVAAGVPVAPGTLGVSVGNALALRIRALQANGQANILSQPSILTSDNLGALIDLSDTFYIQSLAERFATVTPVTVGTSLRVTPRYIEGSEGKQVELTIDIEDGRVLANDTINGLPRIRKSNISTLAIVGDDQTLLIGGYNNNRDEETIEKVPFLGDIPLIGALFRSRRASVERLERLFLIRPVIVSINGNAVVTDTTDYRRVNRALNSTWGRGAGTAAEGALLLVGGQQTQVRPVDRRAAQGSNWPISALPGLLGSEVVALPISSTKPYLRGQSKVLPGETTAVTPSSPSEIRRSR